MVQMDDFEIELKNGFLDEATQLVQDAEQCFLQIETNPEDNEIITKIFRIAHNLKGSAKGVGFDELAKFAHDFESFLLRLKNREFSADARVVNLLLRCNDQVKTMIEGLRKEFSAQFDYSALVEELRNFVPGAASAEIEDREVDQISSEEVQLLRNAPEVPQPEPIAVEPERVSASSSAPVARAAVASNADESIRVSLARLDKLINFVGELSILQTVLQEQVYGDNPALLRRTAHQIGKVSKEVQDLSMSLRMVPVRQTFQKMQRIVRDTASALGKKIQLNLSGEDTELDKTVLEAIADPLVHLVRNAVDHGIEDQAARIERGKPAIGTVMLRAGHQAGRLLIEVSDDGGGISGKKLLAKAIEKGICSPTSKMGEQEAVQLIFAPGFSTKSEVTEVSGRGVGMDVVKTNIEKLNGTIEIKTEVGKGTTFRILLPLTLAIIDGLVVASGGSRFVVPLVHVHETVKPQEGELIKHSTLGMTLQLRGEVIPAFGLSALLKKGTPKVDEGIALIIRTHEQPYAVLVEDILRQQQIVVKRVGAELRETRGYAGSAILGDGKLALILELNELIPKGGSAMKKREAA